MSLTPHIYLVIGDWAFGLDADGELRTARAASVRETGLALRVDPLSGGNREMARAALIKAALETAEASEL